jgi:hypothetical protein
MSKSVGFTRQDYRKSITSGNLYRLENRLQNLVATDSLMFRDKFEEGIQGSDA